MFPHHSTSTKFIRLNTRKCIACWNCTSTCRRHVLGKVDFLGHRHARIDDPTRCTGCRLCVAACDSGAITSSMGEEAMDADAAKKTFNNRAFVSVALLISGMTLPVSGIMNHRLQFEMLTPARHFWMSVHNIAATLFVAFLIAHLSFNRRALIHSLKKMEGVAVSREAVAAIVLVLSIVGLFALHAFHVR